jgi:hypothetical protein
MSRGARVWRTKDRAAALYSADPKAPTMMQCCASQRSSEAADPFFRSALKPWAERDPATSNRHRRPVAMGGRGRNREVSFSNSLPSVCGTKKNALGHHAIADEVPERDQKLARQGHDHLLAGATGVLGAGAIPLRQRTVLLELEKAPGQLDRKRPPATAAW